MIGLMRFDAILRSLVPNDAEFDSLFGNLRSTFSRAWAGSGPVAIDESLYEYQPARSTQKIFEEMRDPIPLVYIPRKPHKNGLLNYQVNVYKFINFIKIVKIFRIFMKFIKFITFINL
jgi:glycine cleavage system protein P-like pyridoxal-binding family